MCNVRNIDLQLLKYFIITLRHLMKYKIYAYL